MTVPLRGFEANSLIIQRVGLRFHAHLLKTSSRHAIELKKTERIDVQTNPESEIRNSKTSVGWHYPKQGGRINTPKNPDYPTLFNICRILSASITQRACFQGLKIASGFGLSDVVKWEHRTIGRGDSAESLFFSWIFYPADLDDPTWASYSVGVIVRVNDQWTLDGIQIHSGIEWSELLIIHASDKHTGWMTSAKI